MRAGDLGFARRTMPERPGFRIGVQNESCRKVTRQATRIRTIQLRKKNWLKSIRDE